MRVEQTVVFVVVAERADGSKIDAEVFGFRQDAQKRSAKLEAEGCHVMVLRRTVR